MNKRGNIWGILIISGALIVLAFLAVLFAFGSAVLTKVVNTVVPEVRNIGMVGDTNFTQISDIAIAPAQSIINSSTWFGGVMYVMALLALFGLAFVYRSTGQKWLIPMFFAMMVILIIVAIFISNTYEAFYNGTDDIAVGLQNQQVLSWMILYSPAVFSILGFIAGAIMFSGSDEGVYQ